MGGTETQQLALKDLCWKSNKLFSLQYIYTGPLSESISPPNEEIDAVPTVPSDFIFEGLVENYVLQRPIEPNNWCAVSSAER